MLDVGTEGTKLKTETFTKHNLYGMLNVATEDTKLKTGTFTKQMYTEQLPNTKM